MAVNEVDGDVRKKRKKGKKKAELEELKQELEMVRKWLVLTAFPYPSI
jgi:hypothetical protein